MYLLRDGAGGNEVFFVFDAEILFTTAGNGDYTKKNQNGKKRHGFCGTKNFEKIHADKKKNKDRENRDAGKYQYGFQ